MKLSTSDRILVFYPFLLFAGAAAYVILEKFGLVQDWGRDQIRWSSVLTFVILGNFSHNFLSLWQIFRIDNFQQWAKSYRFCGLPIWAISPIVYLAFLTLTFMLPATISTFDQTISNNEFDRSVLFALLCLNIFHNLGQTKGVSILLSHRYLKSDASQKWGMSAV